MQRIVSNPANNVNSRITDNIILTEALIHQPHESFILGILDAKEKLPLMPVETDWLLQNRIIGIRLYGDVTVADIQISNQTVTQMLDQLQQADHLIHVIHDAGGVTSIPRRVGEIVKATRSGFTHPKIGWTVAYNMENQLIRFMGDMLGRIFRARFRIVQSYAEAMAFLHEMDGTLPDADSEHVLS